MDRQGHCPFLLAFPVEVDGWSIHEVDGMAD